MKWNSAIVKGIILILFTTKSFAQFEKTSFIQSYHLGITCSKTTNLIFPYAIQSVDRGTKDILVQKVIGTENILQIKADKPNFLETNLSVVTKDGKLYSFILNYLDNPPQLNMAFQKDTFNYVGDKQVFFSETPNEEELSEVAKYIIDAKKTIYGIKDRHETMTLSLSGLYVNNDVFYFQLKLNNRLQVSYQINTIRFFIRDRKKSKRTAVQEREITPIYVYGNDTSIKGESSQVCVIALPKFTLPDDKYLFVQVTENDGGRELNIRVKNRYLLKAQVPLIENIYKN